MSQMENLIWEFNCTAAMLGAHHVIHLI